MIHIQICIIILIFLFIVCLAHRKCDDLQYYTYVGENQKRDPKIVILGGTHGNEPAGSRAIHKYMELINTRKIVLKRGIVIFIPDVNRCGLIAGFRIFPMCKDVNRNYPNGTKINKTVTKLIDDADLVLDFHEGWGFHRKQSRSIGSTLTPTDTEISHFIARNVTEKLNKNLREHKRFKILTSDRDLLRDEDIYTNNKEIKGSLRWQCNLLNKNYILVETTGQNNIQPMEIREGQAMTIINHILENYDMM